MKNSPPSLAGASADLVTAAALADVLGISERTIRKLADDGRVIRAARGKYDLWASIRTYCENLRRTAGNQGDAAAALDLAEQRARLAKEQADSQSLKNAALRGELVEASAVEREWAGVCRNIRAGVLAVPSRVRLQLPHLTVHDIETLDGELRTTLTGLGEGSDTDDNA